MSYTRGDDDDSFRVRLQVRPRENDFNAYAFGPVVEGSLQRMKIKPFY